MRVRHSAWSWLNEIDPLDSVAGNTLIGMFTRLIFRNPFHVALAAIQFQVSSHGFQVTSRVKSRESRTPRAPSLCPYRPNAAVSSTMSRLAAPDLRLATSDLRLGTCDLELVSLGFISLVTLPEIEAGAREVNRVLADLLAQQPPRRAVLVARHDETA